MSWLGDSFSSITGQLSNFTKEVLYEGREEVSDHATELSLANRKVHDLDTECNKLRSEVCRLRGCNEDLETRCRALDLHASDLLEQSRNLKAQHKAKQVEEHSENETKHFQDKIEDLECQLRDCAERHLQQVSALQDHQEERIRQLHQHYNSQHTSDRGPTDDHESTDASSGQTVSSLRAQLSQVECQLVESQHQVEALSEQLRVAHRSSQRTIRQLEKVQQEKTAVSQELACLHESLSSEKSQGQENGLDEEGEDSKAASSSATEASLQDENAQLQTRITELEQLLSEKQQDMSDIMSEKESLDSSLVELDGQHQEAIEQLLAVKQELHNENKSLHQELVNLQDQNLCLQTEVETLTEQLLLQSRTRSKSSHEVQNNEAGTEREEESNLSSILQSVSDISAENLALEERVESLEKHRQNLEVALFESEEQKQSLDSMLSRAQDEIKELEKKLTKVHEIGAAEVVTPLQMRQEECQLVEGRNETLEKDEEIKLLEEKLYACELELRQMQKILTESEENHRLLRLEQEQALREQLELVKQDAEGCKERFELALRESKEEKESLATLVDCQRNELETVRDDLRGKEELEEALLNAKAERDRLEVVWIRSNEAVQLLETDASKNEAEKKQLMSRIAELESIVLEKNSPPESHYFGDSSQNPDLVARLQQLTSENENLQNESDDLHVRLMETSGEKERLRVAFDELAEQNNDVMERCELQRQVVEALELRLEETEKSNAQSLDRLEQELEGMKVEANLLKHREETLLNSNKELGEKCSSFDILRARLEELENMVEGAQSKCFESVSVQAEMTCNEQGAAVKNQVCVSVGTENFEGDNDSTHSKSEDAIDKDICDLKNILKKKDSEILSLNSQLESFVQQSKASSNYTQSKESEITSLKSKINSLTQEDNSSSHNFLEQLRKVEMEKEQLVVILNEKTRECSSLKAEVHKLVGFVSAEKQALNKLQQDNQELVRKQSPDSEMSREVIQNLSRIIKDKDIEIEALKLKVGTLLDIAQQDESSDKNVLEELLEERDRLSKQLKVYQADREQIALLLNQKHQESLRYHEEMQKMAVRLTTENQRYESLKEEHHSVSQLFEEKQKSLLNTQNEVVSLKQRVSELERQHTDLRDKYCGLIDSASDTVQISKVELEKSQHTQETLSSRSADQERLLSEKDQMIYDLGQSLHKVKDDSFQKDQTLTSLQKRLDSAHFQLNDALARLKETEKERDHLMLSWEQMKEEKGMLGETNRSLSMALQKSRAEQDAMRHKMGTLTQVVQKNMLNGQAGDSSDPSADGESPGMLLLAHGQALEAQLQNLTQERDQVQLALSQHQQEKADSAQEKLQLQKQNEKLHRELDRLRNHLLELQDNYTQEVMIAEEREKELRVRLSQAEDKANLSSSAIINASQEATLRVESLQSQLSRIVRQRDAYLEQVSQLEDRVQEQSAANTNLQLALEHIQTGHQREMQEVTKKQQGDMASYVQQISHLKEALDNKESQLSDTSEALAAASRLSEQLDRKEDVLAQLREEISQAQRENLRLTTELKEMQTHTEGKVDKLIMKSLVLNYLMASPNQRPEMVRLLARILDFNQSEMEKAGVKMVRESSILWPGGGWLTNIIHRVTPPSSPEHHNAVATISRNKQVQAQSQPSFSALLVKFLETESQPPAHLQLPIEQMTEGIMNRRSHVADVFPRTQLTPIKTITTTTTQTTTVVAEHPLMRPISTALPTFTPVIVNEDEAKNSSVFLKEMLQ